MKYLTTILFALLATFALAQSPSTFAHNLFESLQADATPCAPLGFDEREYDFSRCGFIGDNLVSINKTLVEQHIERAGFTVVLPWDMSYAGGLRAHTIGFGSLTTMATYVLNYVEMSSSSSFVWLVMNW